MTTQAPPGWYADPTTADQMRWWDGSQWTQDVQPVPTTPPPQEPATALAEHSVSDYAELTAESGPQWWRRKRVLIPAGLVALVGMVGALGDDPESKPIGQADEIQEEVDLEPAGASDAEPASSTINQPTISTTLSTGSTANTTAESTSTSTTATASTAPTTSGASTTALSTTTAPPITASTTAPPTTSTTATAPPTTLEDYVSPGAFCSPEGATGKTSTGKSMVCSSTKKDGTPYDNGRSRWRSP